MLPNFSCHSLRYTFVTRLYEATVNIEVLQELAGHSSSKVTLDVDTTVHWELVEWEFDSFQEKMKRQKRNDRKSRKNTRT